MNFTLYLLSVLSAIFLPAQFLTGLVARGRRTQSRAVVSLCPLPPDVTTGSPRMTALSTCPVAR